MLPTPGLEPISISLLYTVGPGEALRDANRGLLDVVGFGVFCVKIEMLSQQFCQVCARDAPWALTSHRLKSEEVFLRIAPGQWTFAVVAGWKRWLI
jgi:hypothetical protein